MREARRHLKDLQHMRIQTLILSLLFCVASAFAKDVITKTDGTKLDAKVEEITETVVKYRKASNPNGPVYTIPISSVASVLYENGDMDTFNESVSATKVPSDQTTTLSDEELMQLADSQTLSTFQSTFLSDAELLNIYNSKHNTSVLLRKKAKIYRLVGWIGGALIVSAGIGREIYNGSEGYSQGLAIGICAPIGALWCIGFNLKANSIIKKAKSMESYSEVIIENEIMRFDNKSLTAGVNLMGNRMVNSHSLGLSLGLNF